MKHYFNPEIANAAGINAAVVFEYVSFWIGQNEKAGRSIKDGEPWMFSSQKSIADQFDYLSEKQVRTAIEKLLSLEFIKAGNFNRHKYDRTAWYAIGKEGERFRPERPALLTVKADEKEEAGAPIQIINNNYKNKDIKATADALKQRLKNF